MVHGYGITPDFRFCNYTKQFINRIYFAFGSMDFTFLAFETAGTGFPTTFFFRTTISAFTAILPIEESTISQFQRPPS